MDVAYSLPDALTELQMSAYQLKAGQGKKTLVVVKFPPVTSLIGMDHEDIVQAWLAWWKTTAWAINKETPNPHWNSSIRTGKIWNKFGEAAHIADGHPHVYCINCGLVLQHPAVKAMGTKHLINHTNSVACMETLTPVHGSQYATTILPTSRIDRDQSQNIPVFTAATFEDELVRVVVDANLSFRTIDRPSFQRFIRFLRPNAVINSRYKFKTLFVDKYNKAKATLLNDLPKHTKISIALDAWTSSNHLSFLAIKGYYINTRWKLQDKLLDFIPMRGSHTGEAMAKEVIQVLTAANIKHQLLAVTCDNAGNNGTLTRSLQKLLQEQGCEWRAQENTIPCLAHIINLVVQEIIAHLKLAASDAMENGQTLDQNHMAEIHTHMSVPNSLRKVRVVYHRGLSQPDTTGDTSNQHGDPAITPAI